MNCLKCGREVAESQVFCTDCLIQMEKYPVKPGTAVILPNGSPAPPVRKAGSHFHPILSQEEQLRVVKRRLHRLTLMLAVTLLLFAALAFYTAHLLRSQAQPKTGQNYSSVTTSEASGVS